MQPLLDGRPVGYFIFDTGASGFVLDPAVAEALGLEAFGELQVTSMVGKVASRFRCGTMVLPQGACHAARPSCLLPPVGRQAGVSLVPERAGAGTWRGDLACPALGGKARQQSTLAQLRRLRALLFVFVSPRRRAASFQLGPLRIERPLLMELPCTGLVAGLPEGGRVAGIVG